MRSPTLALPMLTMESAVRALLRLTLGPDSITLAIDLDGAGDPFDLVLTAWANGVVPLKAYAAGCCSPAGWPG